MSLRSQRKTLKDLGERGWLDLLANQFAGRQDKHLIVPLGDDAAVLVPPENQQLVVTSDAMVEGTHFKRDWLGWKGLAARAVLAAASDVTAMGGTPFGFTLSLGVPSSVESAHLEDFSRSLSTLCQQWGLLLLGGDTVCSELIFVDVVVLGTVAPSEILCQRGAQEGDALWVTGTLGGSRNLLDKMHSVREEGRTFCLDDPAWMPPVRWNLLPTLRKILPVRAMTDLSDGLALDLHKILRWENLGARIDVELLPLQENRLPSPIPSLPWGEEEERLSSYRNAWLGGEDYELLIVEKGNAQPIGHLCIEDVTLTRIGQVLGTRQGVHLAWQGTEIEIEGEPFQHFGETG